jgi:hypothetical protein
MDPASIYREWNGEDAFAASLVVVTCGAQLARSAKSCDDELGAAIVRDLAEACSPSDVREALAKAGASGEHLERYLGRYEEVRASALSRGAGAGSSDAAKAYRSMQAEKAKLAAVTKAEAARIAELRPRLEESLARKQGSAELLAAAAQARDAYVSRCVAETKLSTGYCWHATLARPLTEQIAKLADLSGDKMVAYLEWDTLEHEADLRAPAAQLWRSVRSIDRDSVWTKLAEPKPVRSLDERLAAQKNLEFIGEEVLGVKKNGARATLAWKTRVSGSVGYSCGDPRLKVTQSGDIKIVRPCYESSRETTTHANAPVDLPAAEVEGITPGQHAVVILPKGKRSGRLMQASPTFVHTGREKEWHRFRHTESRPPRQGIP